MAASSKIAGVIPARMGSSRYPGKPLAEVLGRPMIEHVFRRSAMSEILDEVVIATCDQEIYTATESFGARAVMTSSEHQRASDRVAEVAENIEADIYVMVQGDEPMVTPGMVDAALAPMLGSDDVSCVNLVKRIESEKEFRSRDTIKVVRDEQARALYFSREPIPTTGVMDWSSIKAFKQVCIIPFRRRSLLAYGRLEPTPLERSESVDMLRFLEHGIPVHTVETEVETHAVDRPEDIALVEEFMDGDPLIESYLGSPQSERGA